MKKLATIFRAAVTVMAMAILSTPSCAQADPDWVDFAEVWKFGKGKLGDLAPLQAKGYVRIVIEPFDTSTYIYTFTRVKKVWAYDSTWSTTEYNNSSSSISYSAGWSLGTGLPKFYSGDYQYGTPASLGTVRTATFTVTNTLPFRISFDSERYTGPPSHGLYTLALDGGVAVTINAALAPINSDKDRLKSSWRSAVLPAGTHTVVISTTAQMVVDRFAISALTLTPRP